MYSQRSLCSITGAATAMALFAMPTVAKAADVDIDVYRPRPVYVAPAPRVYVAPRVIRVGPACVTRRVRVWVGDHYAYRTVRRCV
jgi:hypothetical protein